MDFDHTLMDNSVVRASIEQACVEIAASIPDVTSDALLSANTKAFAEYWPTMQPRCEIGEADVLDVSLETWRRTLRACGSDPDLGQLAFDVHQRIVGELARLFDDVPAFLHRVKAAGLRTALVTNSSPRSQTAKIELMGLTSFFDAIVISGQYGIVKPDPEIFHIALAQLDCAPGDAWHVGDNLSSDIAGAAAAGVVSVWLNRDGQHVAASDPVPDIEVASLDELAGLVS